jgi:hypothetical protein
MPAKSKLTPELQKLICTLLQAGNTKKVAAEAAGIAESTFYDWMQTTPAFAAAVEKAEAEAEATLVTRVAKAASNSWRAAAWLLERRNPDEWGIVSGRRPSGDDEKPEPGVMDAPARRTSHLRAA